LTRRIDLGIGSGWKAGEFTLDIDFLNERIEAGKIKPVIDRVYSLEHTAEAHRWG
jgi:NADPH:quinone reductase-like Zn-dependent oxidoreductase